MCRVNELVQLASSALTVTANSTSQHQLISSQNSARLNDSNRLQQNSADLGLLTQPDHIASRRSDALGTDDRRDTGSRWKSADNLDASVKSPAETVTCTQSSGTGEKLQPAVDSASCDREETLLRDDNITPQRTSLSNTLAVATSDTLSVSVTEFDKMTSTVGATDSSTVSVSSVKPSTSQAPSVESASHVTTMSVVTSQPVLAAHVVSSEDVVTRANSTGSTASHVNASSRTRGNLAPKQSSRLSTGCSSTRTRDVPMSSATEPLLGKTRNTSSTLIADKRRKAATDIENCNVETTVSSMQKTSVNSAVTTTVTVVPGGRTANVTTSSVLQSKPSSKERTDHTKATSASKKRLRSIDTGTSAEASNSVETEEKQMKRAKLDASVVASSTASSGHTDTVSTVAATGLTDDERVECYKTIGVREERKRMIGLKTAERLRHKTSPMEKAAVVGKAESSQVDKSADVTVAKSNDNSSSRLSLTSPRKPARRVPLVTVSTTLPATPTIFTLRSRARLAQLQHENKMPSKSEDAMMSEPAAAGNMGVETKSSESNPQARLNDFPLHVQNLTVAVNNVDCKQPVNSSEVHSAKLDEAASTLSVVSRPSESVTTDTTLQSPAATDTNWKQPVKLKDRSNGRQAQSSAHKPNSHASSLTDSAAVSRVSDMSKTSLAASLSADVKSGLNASGKYSTSVPTAVSGRASSDHKTLSVTASALDGERTAAVSSGKTATKQQSHVLTRSSTKNTGSKSDNSKRKTYGNIQNSSVSLHKAEPCSVTAVHEKSASTAKLGEQTSVLGKNTASNCNKLEPTKPLKAVNENNGIVSANREKIPRKEAQPCDVVKNAASKITDVVESGNRADSKSQNKQTSSSRGVSSVKQDKKVKQQDTVSSEVLLAAVTSPPSNCADTSKVCNKSPATIAPGKDLSAGIDTNSNQRTSTRTDLCQAILDACMSAASEKPKLQASAMGDPLTRLTALCRVASRIETSTLQPNGVDLFDVAIAGTPAQYPCADDSSDSLLSSSFNIDAAEEGVDAMHDDVIPASVDFIIPDNPCAEVADTSVCSKCELADCS